MRWCLRPKGVGDLMRRSEDAGDTRHGQFAARLLGTRVPVCQLLPKHGPAAVDPRADGAQLHAQRFRHFVVGQAFEVAEDDGGAEVRGKLLQRGLDVQVQVVELEALFRTGLAAGKPRLRILGEGVEPDPGFPARLVQEEVGGDPVQPAVKRAWLEVLQ